MATVLKDLLPHIFAQHAWKYNLMRNWQHIMGPLCSKVRIEKICDDTLVLGSASSCWMQELYLLSPLIIKTINQNLDKPRIKQIRFKKVGATPQSYSKKENTRQKQAVKEILLTLQQKQALEQIDDPQLRKALEQFLKRCYGERE